MGDWKQRSTNDPTPKRGKPAAKQRADFRKRKRGSSGEPPDDGSKSYTKRSSRNPSQQKFRHRVRIATLTLFSLALVAGLGWYLIEMLTRRETPLLVLSISTYKAPFAPNSFALEDAERMENFFGHESGGKKLIAVDRVGHEEEPFAQRLTSSLTRFLKNHKPGGPGRDVVIIYLSAHGVVNKNNEACLLPSEADALDDTTWLKVSEVLRTIEKKKSETLDPDTKILLILDAGRIHSDWSLGILYNGFADRLKAAVESSDLKNLFVLNSTSGGQAAWTDPRHARSIFGYYVAEGLRGAADDPTRNRDGEKRKGYGDGEISLNELHEFVKSHVAGWVKTNRSSHQIPLLIPHVSDDNDFPLTWADTNYRENLVPTDDPDERESKIGDLWRERGRLRTKNLHRGDPVNWAKLEHLLLRLEHLSLAGEAYWPQFEETKRDAEKLLEKMKLSEAVPEEKVFSIRLAEQCGQLPKNMEQGYLADARKRWQAAQKLKGIEKLLTDVAKSSERNPANVVEIQFLDMLAHNIERLTDDQVNKVKLPQAVLLAVKARDAAERAAAPSDVRAHYWIQREVDEADSVRRLAEDRLYVGSNEKVEEAKSELQPLIARYRGAAKSARNIAAAYDLRDETWTDASYLAQWILARAYRKLVVPGDGAASSGAGEKEVDDLLDVIREAHALGKALDSLRAGSELPSSEALQKELIPFDNKFETDIRKYTKDKNTIPITILRDAMRGPLLLSSDPGTMCGRYRDEIFDPDNSPATDNPLTGLTPADDTEYLKMLAAGPRVHPALAILSLDADQRDETADREALLKQLAEMGGQVRSSLGRVWDEEAEREAKLTIDRGFRKLSNPGLWQRSRVIRQPLATADRLMRAATPIYPPKQSKDNPAILLRPVDLHFEYLWHADRILEDYWGKSNDKEAENYFSAASGGYIASARSVPGLPSWIVDYEDFTLDHRRKRLGKARISISGMSAKLEEGVPYALLPSVKFIGESGQFDYRGGQQFQGEARVVMEDQVGDPVVVQVDEKAVSRFPVPLKKPRKPRDIEMQERPKKVKTLTAALWYRGYTHDLPITFPKQPVPGRQIVVAHPKFEETKVTIISPEKPPIVYLAIILDCSGSMETTVKLPALKDPDKPRRMDGSLRYITKYKEARFSHVCQRLVNVLNSLPKDNYHISLWLYGHRVGWLKGAPPFQIDRKPGAPKDIMPSHDVELVLKFTPAALAKDKITKRLNELDKVRPFHGITPLFLSMVEALKSFETIEGGVASQDSRQLLVITDGANVQVDENYKLVRDRTEPWHVAEAAARDYAKDVRIDVYGISLGNGTLKKLEELGEKITKKKGRTGLFKIDRHEKKGIKDLEKNLRELMRRPEFRVVRRDGEASTDWMPLNGLPLDIKEEFVGRRENCKDGNVGSRILQVEVQGIKSPPKPLPIRLHGGENVKLSLTYENGKFVLKHVETDNNIIEYKKPNEDKEANTKKNSSRKYRIACHRPVFVASAIKTDGKNSKDVVFRFSVRNKPDENGKDSGKFVPRPRFVLAKITPLGADSRAYHFYEPLYDSAYSLPCFTFRAIGWPGPGIAKADIELWYVIGDVDSNVTESVPAVLKTRETTGKSGDLTVKLAHAGDNPPRWNVTEQYARNRSELFRFVLESNPQAIFTRRTYYPDQRKVLHEFQYQHASIPCILVRRKSDIKTVAGKRVWSEIKIDRP